MQWLVYTRRPNDPGWRRSFPTFEKALKFLRQTMSRYFIEDLLDRLLLTEPGECESIPACLVEGEDLDRKRLRIYDAGRYRGLLLRTEVEVEEDPRETRIFVWLHPDRCVPKKGYRARMALP